MTATVEEHIAGLRAAGERMPPRFLRAGLIYTLIEGGDHSGHYWYEPFEDFVVDGILYRPSTRDNTSSMIDSFADDGGTQARMTYSQPPTEAELDHWVRTPHLTNLR